MACREFQQERLFEALSRLAGWSFYRLLKSSATRDGHGLSFHTASVVFAGDRNVWILSSRKSWQGYYRSRWWVGYKVRGVQPRDEIEAMLAVQIGTIHQATMMMARRLDHVDNITQQDAAERALNKLARTYTTQLEARKRFRTGGQQKGCS